jgi:hypothetical protein
VDDFTLAYLECALWSSTDNADESGGEPLDANYSIDDIAEKSISIVEQECQDFRDMAKDLLDTIGADDEQNGHDFWLTRNGHGAGFWDRGYGKPGDELSKIAKSFGSCDPVVGDDGKVYFE